MDLDARMNEIFDAFDNGLEMRAADIVAQLEHSRDQEPAPEVALDFSDSGDLER